MNMLAPIAIFCYNRLTHLQSVVESLKKNRLSASSILYIFSDGPNLTKIGDAEKVEMVRDFIQTLNGFKEVKLMLSENNKGLAASVIEGISLILDKYDKVIVLEDDILVSPDFLEFMNNTLDKYAQNHLIYSVSGYSFQLENTKLEDDIFLIKRVSSWGWGTWKNRWQNVDWKVNDYSSFISSSEQRDKFKDGGIDYLPMLVKQQRGIINSWAIRWAYHHFKNDAYCLVTRLSKVQNIGTDGSGTNFTSSTNKYNTVVHVGKINYPSIIVVNERANSYIRQSFKPSLFRRLKNYFYYNVW